MFEDYLVLSSYAMLFDGAVMTSANSPLADYPGYLLNYETPMARAASPSSDDAAPSPYRFSKTIKNPIRRMPAGWDFFVL